jgi:hypothetical protein
VSIASTAIAISAVSFLCVWPPPYAYADNPTDIVALQAKADQAERRDRCFLYAELVSRLIDITGQQYNSGDQDRASDTLEQVQRYAEKMRLGVAEDSKRLKDSELLLEQSSHRLTEILHEASYENRPALETTLRQLNHLQMRLMLQIFKR